MSCSLVFTGAGGSGRANAVHVAEVDAACDGTVELLVFTIARPAVPLEVLWEAVTGALECLRL